MRFHNTIYKLLLAAVIGSSAVHSMYSRTDIVSQPDAEHRAKALSGATTSSDSIKILLDVYELSNQMNKTKVRGQILNLAQRTDDTEVVKDVVRELATSTDDAGQLNRLIEISESLPDADQQNKVTTVLQMEKAQADAPNINERQLQDQLATSRRNYNIASDPYAEIENIYKTMMYLGASSQGPMYFQYIKRLEELIDKLPEEDHAIKNLYFTTAAIYYTRKKDYKKAIELDRRLIKELDSMKALYQKEGKSSEDLDYFYYVSYRRMLRNFKGLTPQEIEDVFQKCVQLAEINEQAGEAFGNGGLTKSYYYFATGRYSLAAPELKRALAAPDISDFRRQELLGLLARCYRELGDRNGELEALREYVVMAVKDRNQRREDMYREFELRNEVDKVLAKEYKIEEHQRKENSVMRKTSITLVYVLGLILIFMCQAYFRLRHKVKDLELRNNKLRKNIEYIFDDGVPSGTKDLRHGKNRLKG